MTWPEAFAVASNNMIFCVFWWAMAKIFVAYKKCGSE
jgi:hypothetical protein